MAFKRTRVVYEGIVKAMKVPERHRCAKTHRNIRVDILVMLVVMPAEIRLETISTHTIDMAYNQPPKY
jgi:hypothetical protein